MEIVHLASEFAPLAKVGGLADVVASLAKATQKEGHKVTVFLPKYEGLFTDAKIVLPNLVSYDGPYPIRNTVWEMNVGGVRLLLLETQHEQRLYGRGKIYGEKDDLDRFFYFCRTALEALFKMGLSIDVLHLHDWPTALAAVLYRDMYAGLGLKVKGIVLTIHNLEHQGWCLPKDVTRTGLRGDDLLRSEKLQDPQRSDLLNVLKGGIIYSNFVTTVSPNYAKEIQTPEGGCGLAEVLRANNHKLQGILNGLDFEYWNPKTDPLIPGHYDVESYKQGKEIDRKELGTEFRLREKKAPLVCAITRLVPQKAPDLIEYALQKTLEMGGQFFLLGSSPTPEIDQKFRALQKKLARNKNVAFCFDHNETLAHQVYAASDMIVIPSLFEPCGLTQMIGQHYGAVPIVRATGGLVDTVTDQENGFMFLYPDKAGIDWALSQAFTCYEKNPTKWQSIVHRGMQADFSWKKPVNAYIEIYKKF
ncbi:MAG: glycogen synthase [Verrucomicrobia bacterium]|nr:glycogen synthase [Verrucomicrobiota bacterium]